MWFVVFVIWTVFKGYSEVRETNKDLIISVYKLAITFSWIEVISVLEISCLVFQGFLFGLNIDILSYVTKIKCTEFPTKRKIF